MPYVVAVYLEKGGSTKTTTTVHLAHAFARKGLRSLIVDIDAQRHASQWLFPGDPPSLTINEVVRKPEMVADAVVPSRIHGVDLLYGSRVLPMTAESVLKISDDGTPRNQVSVLQNVLAGLDGRHQLVWIDCSPSVGLLNANALVAADHVLVPMDLADMSFQGLEDVAKTLTQMRRNGLISSIPDITLLLTQTESEESKTTDEIRRKIVGDTEHPRPYRVLNQTIRARRQMRGIYHTHMTAFDLAETGGFKYSHLRAVADDYAAAGAEFASIVAAAIAKQKSATEGI